MVGRGGRAARAGLGQAGAAANNAANNNNNANAANNALLAGANPFLLQRPVGGISINADGLLENAGTDVLGSLSQLRKQTLQGCPPTCRRRCRCGRFRSADWTRPWPPRWPPASPCPMSWPSWAACSRSATCSSIPSRHDIVLVGPAEGWKVDARGNIVGATTGRPVMLLDDLLVALRTAAGPGQAGITCSIDPTKAGLEQLHSRLATLHTIGNPERTAAAIEQALGRQQISFTGVPASSHFAGVLVAADYRMKRLAMNFEPVARSRPAQLS